MYMSLSIRLLLFVLLVMEGLESRPVPGLQGSLGTRGRGRGHEYREVARGFGPPRGRGSSYVDHFADYPVPSGQDERTLRRFQKLQKKNKNQTNPYGPHLASRRLVPG